jgi:hypothetical protein
MEASKFLKNQVDAVELAKEIKAEDKFDIRTTALYIANAWHQTELEYNVKQLIKDAKAIEAYLKDQ